MTELTPDYGSALGGPVDSTMVSFRLFSNDLDPSEVTALMGCEPTKSARAGTPVGGGLDTVSDGYWVLSVEGSAPLGPDELIEMLFQKLGGMKTGWAQLSGRFKRRLDIFIGITASMQFFDLRPDTLRLLAAAQLDVGTYLFFRSTS